METEECTVPCQAVADGGAGCARRASTMSCRQVSKVTMAVAALLTNVSRKMSLFVTLMTRGRAEARPNVLPACVRGRHLREGCIGGGSGGGSDIICGRPAYTRGLEELQSGAPAHACAFCVSTGG